MKRPARKRPADEDLRPYCVDCRKRMMHGGGYKGNPRSVCGGCGRSCISRSHSQRGKRDEDGGKLLGFINSQMPPHYPAEMRRELGQEIAVDILRKRLRRRDLTRSKVGEYARRFFKGESNRFRDISLEHEIGGGLRLGETLAG